MHSLRSERLIASIARRRCIQVSLTESLRNRSELLHAVSFAAKQFLTAPTIEDAMGTVLKAVGEAARADRVLVFRESVDYDGTLRGRVAIRVAFSACAGDCRHPNDGECG